LVREGEGRREAVVGRTLRKQLDSAQIVRGRQEEDVAVRWGLNRFLGIRRAYGRWEYSSNLSEGHRGKKEKEGELRKHGGRRRKGKVKRGKG